MRLHEALGQGTPALGTQFPMRLPRLATPRPNWPHSSLPSHFLIHYERRCAPIHKAHHARLQLAV